MSFNNLVKIIVVLGELNTAIVGQHNSSKCAGRHKAHEARASSSSVLLPGQFRAPCHAKGYVHTQRALQKLSHQQRYKWCQWGRAISPFFPDVFFELHGFSLAALYYTMTFFLHRHNYYFYI